MALLDEAVKPFYDSWESVSGQDRVDQTRNTLAEFIEYSRKNVPWYQSRLAEFDPKSEYPLKNVPTLKSSDLRKLLPPVSTELVVKGVKDISVFQRSLFGNDESYRVDSNGKKEIRR